MSSRPKSEEKSQHGGGNLGYALKRTQHAFRTELDRELAPLGVTAPQYAVLSSLSIEPGISNAALARAALVTPQSMLGIVALLEKQGLVKRAAVETHGRVLAAHLTDRGVGVLARAHRVANAVERRMIGGMAPRDIDQARRALDQFLANLSSEPAAKPTPRRAG